MMLHGADEAALDTLDDATLVLRTRTDPAVFAVLYQRHVRRVYHYLLTYAATSEDAADLTQHVFLRALEALPGYADRGLPFSAWLIRMARNAATDVFRRQRRTIPWDHIPEAWHPFVPDDPEGITLRLENLNQLRLLVAQLPPSQQELLYLRFSAKLTSREIGALLGRSEGAVQRHLHRIMHTLKERYRAADDPG